MIPTWLDQYTLLTFDNLDSTNKEAIRLAKAGVRGNFVISAREQREAKGQRNRKWHSLKGNMSISIMLESELEFSLLRHMPYIAACSVYEGIIHAFDKSCGMDGIDMKLKWPNDVLINDKKCCGILIESITLPDTKFMVIGIGLNIATHPKEIDQPCTDLNSLGLTGFSSDDVMSFIMEHFVQNLAHWQVSFDFKAVKSSWLKRAYRLNKEVSIDTGRSVETGIFRDIAEDGAIILEFPDGKRHNIVYGDLQHNQKIS